MEDFSNEDPAKPIFIASSMNSSDVESEKQMARTHTLSGIVQIALAFVTVFCPLVLIATLLCLFVTLPIWTIQNTPQENANLPMEPLDDSFLTTKIFSHHVTLTSSFASNVAQLAASPFLLLFSFLVALELSNRHDSLDQDTTKLLRGDRKVLFNWTILRLWPVRKTRITNATKIAGVGALISIALTVLLLVGDKVLQATIGPTVQRVYVDLGLPYYTGSFKINETTCPRQETIPDVYAENALPPCSIDNQTSPWTLWQAPTAYRVLAAGLLNQTGDYNKEDFNALWNASDSGTFDFTQLVTHIDRVTRDQHVHYFDPMSAQEDSYSQKPRKTDIVSGDYDRLGLDYIANTTSIVTKCRPVTQECGLRSSTEDDSSVPYHCSDSLNGDLNEIPANGLERLKGWNTTFYDGNSGDPRSVSIASQLNPFSYNVTVIVDSINIGGLEHFNDPQVPKGIVVGVSDGRVGFALSCTSTVYDVTYSLVDGNVYAFNTTRAEPHTAAIVKAPLQAGFGSYALYEKAAMSVLLTNLTVMDAMELAFSQTFLALAAGVYSPAPNLEERYRYDLELTKIAKGPFYFLVVCMFFYAFVVLVFAVIALSIFWRSDVGEWQARLIPASPWFPNLPRAEGGILNRSYLWYCRSREWFQ